jgi:hypothetical protein
MQQIGSVAVLDVFVTSALRHLLPAVTLLCRSCRAAARKPAGKAKEMEPRRAMAAAARATLGKQQPVSPESHMTSTSDHTTSTEFRTATWTPPATPYFVSEISDPILVRRGSGSC